MRRKLSPGTYQPDFLYKRIAPFEDNKEELIGSLCYRPFVIESHHGGLEGLTDIELTEIELTLLHHARQCENIYIYTSCRNSTDSLLFPDVFTKDILTQVLNPPEKVHME